MSHPRFEDRASVRAPTATSRHRTSDKRKLNTCRVSGPPRPPRPEMIRWQIHFEPQGSPSVTTEVNRLAYGASAQVHTELAVAGAWSGMTPFIVGFVPEQRWCVLVENRECWDLTQAANSRHQSMTGENVVQEFRSARCASRPPRTSGTSLVTLNNRWRSCWSAPLKCTVASVASSGPRG